MKIVLLFGFYFTVAGITVFAQSSPGKILSPRPGSEVPNEELFIAFQKKPELRWEDFEVKVYLDNNNLTPLSKIAGNLLTVLATHRMKPGEHKIIVRFSAEGKIPLESKWNFTVPKGQSGGAVAKEGTPFSLRSDLYTQSRFTSLSGPGQFLRQEPASLQTLNFRGSAFYKNLEFPFRFFITNQEQSSLQWRNTYMLGVKSKRFGIFGGDVFPGYQRQLLNGSKVRGGRACVKFRNTTFDVTYGAIQRGIEGFLRQYDVALGFPPVNLDTGTGLFKEPGNYRRDVLAAQVLFEGKSSKDRTTLTFLRGTDKASSIGLGGVTGENIVFGFAHKTESKNQIFQLDFGVAGSLTTRDTRAGAASIEEIENLYDRKPAVNPESIESLFTINASTTPLRITGLPSVSVFANTRLNVLAQHFSVQFERVGGSFYSYGEPFLINDRRSVAFGDWVHLWKKRVMVSVNYRNYVNNLSDEKPLTQQTGNLQSSLRFQLKPELPQLVFSCNDFRRKGEESVTGDNVIKRTVQTWTAGLNQQFSFGKTRPGFHLSYSRNNRLDKLRKGSDFFTDALNVRLGAELPTGFSASLEYQFLLLSNDTSDFNRQNGYGFRLRYQTTNKKFNMNAGARQFRTEETIFTPEANRRTIDGKLEYFVRKDMSVSVQAGRSEYSEAASGNRNYEEFWGEAGLRFRWR